MKEVQNSNKPKTTEALVGLGLLVFLVLGIGWLSGATGGSSQSVSNTSTEAVETKSTPKASPAAAPNCIPATGLLNAGMKLYLSNQCGKPFATLLGEEVKDGERLVRIQFETGEVELKTPQAVMTQAFVSRKDPKFPSNRVN